MNVLFPGLAIEWRHLERADRSRIEAVCVDTDARRMGSRHIVGFHAAMAAKIVLRDTRVKRIRLDRILAAQESEIRFRYDQVEIAAHSADTAIALIGLDVRGRLDFKLHAAAMTASFMHGHNAALLTPSAKPRADCLPAWHSDASAACHRQLPAHRDR